MLHVPSRLSVTFQSQVFRYELREGLGEVPYGARYRAIDVSGDLHPEPGHALPQEVSLELIRRVDAAHGERLDEGFRLFQALGHGDPSLLRPFLLGAAEGGPAAGLAVLVTEPWDDTLEQVLARQGSLTDDQARALFEAVAHGLFSLHEAGWAHGDLAPSNVVWAGDRGWKLAAGHPARGARRDRPGDLLDAGRLFLRALGLPGDFRPGGPARPIPTGPDRGDPARPGDPRDGPAGDPLRQTWRAVDRWLAARPGSRPLWTGLARGWQRVGDWLENAQGGPAGPSPLADDGVPPREKPPPEPGAGEASRPGPDPAPIEVPTDWLAVLSGCLEPDAARRWSAARLLFGPGPPPVVEDLWAQPVDDRDNAFRLGWSRPPAGRVRIYDLGGQPTVGLGEVCSLAALEPLGRPVPVAAGAETTVVTLEGESRRLQAVTELDDGRRVAVFGQSIELTRVPDVRGLEVRMSRGRMHATWVWPERIHLAYVVVRGDHFAATPESGMRVECLRHLYEANGRFELPAPVQGSAGVFVTVFAAVRTAAGLRFAPGAAPGARARLAQTHVTLTYEAVPVLVGSPPLPGGEYRLILTPSRPIELPELLLVARHSEIPLNHGDGTVILVIEAGARCARDAPLVRRFRPALPGRCKARLFCRHDHDYQWLELISVPIDGVALG